MRFLLLLLFPISCFGQYDFDGDGHIDHLNLQTLEYQDGKSGESYIFEKHSNFSDFLDFIAIPKGLENYPDLLDSLERSVMVNLTEMKAGLPLLWLLNAYSTREILGSNPVFSETFSPGMNWYPWAPEFPEAGYVKISRDTLNLPHFDSDWEHIPEFNQGWLIYYGHNHRQNIHNAYIHEFTEAGKTGVYTLYQTSHGLICRKGDEYAWIFHSNGSLTGGPNKLRWSSVGEVLCYKSYVFIHHVSPVLEQNRVFVVSLTDGQVGKLSLPENFHSGRTDCILISFNSEKLEIRNSCEEENKKEILITLDELAAGFK